MACPICPRLGVQGMGRCSPCNGGKYTRGYGAVGMTTVCIIIPSLNRPEELASTVRAAVHQTRDCGWLIVDQSDAEHPHLMHDGATPGASYRWLRDMRGTANARNYAIAHLPAGVDYVSFWDDDDYPSPRYVEVLAGLLDGNPDAQIAACQTKHLGYILPPRHANTYSRMIRRECINGHVWPEGPGGDQKWWAQFDRLKTVNTFECLYETGNADHGGERDPTGYF